MLGIIFFYRLRYNDHSPIVKEYKKLNEQNKRENFMNEGFSSIFCYLKGFTAITF